MTMQTIGGAMAGMDFKELFQRAHLAAERHQREMQDLYGADFDTNQCWYCGGRGVLPGNQHRYCTKCDVGIQMQGQREGWEKSRIEWETAVPVRFREYRMATHPNADATRQVSQWLRQGMDRGQNLYLAGPVGTGKTGLAIAAMWEAHQRGRTIHYTTVPDMLSGLRPTGPDQDRNEATMHDLQTVGVLLLDDLGTEKPTEWTAAQQYQLINGRYHNQLPTIVTTNMRPDVLAGPDRLGGRTVSRLAESMQVVWMDGEDLRRSRKGNR